MEELLKEIEVLVETKKCEKGEFNVYHAFGKDNRKYEIKFKRSVTNLPTEHCTIVVKSTNISRDKTYKYPRFWISAIEEIKAFVAPTIKDEDIPF